MADKPKQFVDWFRLASPYIHAHRGQTFVLSFGGEAVANGTFRNLIHDIALLSSLGIRLVIVPGAWPQVDERLKARGIELRVEQGVRITDEQPRSVGCEHPVVVGADPGEVVDRVDAALTTGLEVMDLQPRGSGHSPGPDSAGRVR